MTFRTCARNSPKEEKGSNNSTHLVLSFLRPRVGFSIPLLFSFLLLVLLLFLFIERALVLFSGGRQFTDSSRAWLPSKVLLVIYRLPPSQMVKRRRKAPKFFLHFRLTISKPIRNECVCVDKQQTHQVRACMPCLLRDTEFNWMHDRPPLQTFHFSSL